MFRVARDGAARTIDDTLIEGFRFVMGRVFGRRVTDRTRAANRESEIADGAARETPRVHSGYEVSHAMRAAKGESGQRLRSARAFAISRGAPVTRARW